MMMAGELACEVEAVKEMARQTRSLDSLPLDAIKADTPIRLELAARLAFPGGGMTAAGLRTEARKGRLAVAKLAGKDFTTLAAVEEMFRLCMVPTTSGSSPAVSQPDEPDVHTALAAARAAVRRLK